eukprot:TRINITY_DN5578_c0_g1_i2.p1 TRINITY_DN5578_c0_g1~~TRINITY_DN5578_c0_g1_i2.p1  ORF type:complete len:117 (-),score=10.95 TRINITY_DN5578_c0_g1_i2:173-523(-)
MAHGRWVVVPTVRTAPENEAPPRSALKKKRNARENKEQKMISLEHMEKRREKGQKREERREGRNGSARSKRKRRKKQGEASRKGCEEEESSSFNCSKAVKTRRLDHIHKNKKGTAL